MMKRKSAEESARGAERRLMNAFDCVSTISPQMLRRLEDKGVPADKRLFFPNGVDCAAIAPLPPAGNRFREQLGVADNVKIAMYSGAMGEKQGLELVIEAARRLAGRSDILFVLAGSGAAAP